VDTIAEVEIERLAREKIRLALAELVGRILLALIFLDSGLGKITAYAATLDYMASKGVPGELLPVAVATEIVGGVALIAGWKTRVASFLLAGFTLMSGAIFHSDLGDPGDRIHLLKNLSIVGGFVLVIVHGPGMFSLDRRAGTA
jgi:putative oxidoreductase